MQLSHLQNRTLLHTHNEEFLRGSWVLGCFLPMIFLARNPNFHLDSGLKTCSFLEELGHLCSVVAHDWSSSVFMCHLKRLSYKSLFWKCFLESLWKVTWPQKEAMLTLSHSVLDLNNWVIRQTRRSQLDKIAKQKGSSVDANLPNFLFRLLPTNQLSNQTAELSIKIQGMQAPAGCNLQVRVVVWATYLMIIELESTPGHVLNGLLKSNGTQGYESTYSCSSILLQITRLHR
jgi:hypothetical protein